MDAISADNGERTSGAGAPRCAQAVCAFFEGCAGPGSRAGCDQRILDFLGGGGRFAGALPTNFYRGGKAACRSTSAPVPATMLLRDAGWVNALVISQFNFDSKHTATGPGGACTLVDMLAESNTTHDGVSAVSTANFIWRRRSKGAAADERNKKK